MITGSCQNFEKERGKIIKFIGDSELGAKTKVEYQCYSTGISMGWEFFELCLDPDLVYSLFSIFPDMKKKKVQCWSSSLSTGFPSSLRSEKLEYYLRAK